MKLKGLFLKLAVLMIALVVGLSGCGTLSPHYQLNMVEDVKIINGLLYVLVRSERGVNTASFWSHNTTLESTDQSFFLLTYRLDASNQLIQPDSSELVFRYTEESKIALNIIDEKTLLAMNVQAQRLEPSNSFIIQPGRFQIIERTNRNSLVTTRSKQFVITKNVNDGVEIFNIFTRRIETNSDLQKLTSHLTPSLLGDSSILTDDLKYVLLRNAEDFRSGNYRVCSGEGVNQTAAVPFRVWDAESIDGQLHVFGFDYEATQAQTNQIAKIRNLNTGNEYATIVPDNCGRPVWDYVGNKLLFPTLDNITTGITSERTFRLKYVLWDYVNNRVNTVKIVVSIGQ